jgi:hypothetical protein
MAYIKDNFVFWGIQAIVQADNQLHRSETGRKMPSCLGNNLDHPGADLTGQRAELAQI